MTLHSKPSLTVVLPVYNGAGWISRSLRAADTAIVRGGFAEAEILVVDDGSTDGTLAEVRATDIVTPLRVLSQENQGRFLARRRGLDEARGDYLLFIDTRVFLDPDAFAYVVPLLDDDNQVWTADVRVVTEGNPIARFWKCIEHVAWRQYHNDRRHVRYGIGEFDYYPKGTTALFCPTALMREAYAAFSPTVADPTKINDDTALLRYVAERTPINIAPEYGCQYHARSTLEGFLKHAHHRGSVLIDGYLHPGVRFASAIKAVLALTPVALVLALRRPKLALAGAVVGAAGAGAVAKAKGAEAADAAVLSALSVPFGVAYLAGMWRGVASRVAHRRGTPTNAGAAA